MTLIEFTEILGNVGEFLGSIAVFVTLIYLAMQVRQSKMLLERSERIALSQVHQARADSRVGLNLIQISPDFPDSLIGLWDREELPDALTPREFHFARNLMAANVVILDNALYQAELGLLDQHTLDGAKNVIETKFRMWEELGVRMTPRITEYYHQSLERQARQDGA